MVPKRPTILVLADQPNERAAIAELLREAGFAVVVTRQVRGGSVAIKRTRFAASVVAVASGDASQCLHQLGRAQPRLPGVVVVEAAATQAFMTEADAVVTRPFAPHELLGHVFELVLRGDGSGEPEQCHAAEIGITAARLACLARQRSVAGAP